MNPNPQHFQDTPLKDPVPATAARTEEERVLGSDGSAELAQKKLNMSKLLDEIQEQLNESDLEIEAKENLLAERLSEIEEKEKRVCLVENLIAEEKRKVADREKKVELLEFEMEAKESMEISVVKLVIEKEKEEAVKEFELVSKLTHEKSCQLVREVKEFNLKQRLEAERKRIEAEQIKAREKELQEKEEILKAEAEEIETKRIKAEQLEVREKELQEKEEILKVKTEEIEKASKLLEEKRIIDGQQLEARKKKLQEKDKMLKAKAKEIERKAKELELKMQKMMELGERGETSKKRLLEVKRSESDDDDDSLKRSKHDDGKDKETEPINEGGDVTIVEAEFNNFKKTINSFEIGQLWALYDRRIDNMPRLYGRVKGIVKSRSCIHVKWLHPKTKEGSVPVTIPVSCGRYQSDKTAVTKDINHLEFSHKMHGVAVRGKNFTGVYPCWNKDWNSNNTRLHKAPYKYDFVEILVEFHDRYGVAGVCLKKVDGFVSVYKYAEHEEKQGGLLSLKVPADEMNRFSHKVPSFKLTREERQGVHVGSFELDPSAIPRDNNNEEAIKEEAFDHQDGSSKDVPIIILD